MTPLNTIIEEEKKKARVETQNHCQKGYEGILQQEVIDGTVSYWGKRTDTLLTTAIQRAYEAGQAERDTYWKERVREEVEGMKSGQKIDNGHDCYEADCSYCANVIVDQALDTLLDNLK